LYTVDWYPCVGKPVCPQSCYVLGSLIAINTTLVGSARYDPHHAFPSRVGSVGI